MNKKDAKIADNDNEYVSQDPLLEMALMTYLMKANIRRKKAEKALKAESRRHRQEMDEMKRLLDESNDKVRTREWRQLELERREEEYRKWRNNVNELVRQENERHNALYSLQQCSCCKEKVWRKKYLDTYDGMRTFVQKYINIIDDMLRQKNLPDNVKARFVDMRTAMIESREFLENVLSK